MRDLRRFVGHRVIVLLDDQRSIDGTLVRTGDVLELESATYLDASTTTTAPVDGTVLVPAARVYWIQVP